MSVVLPNFRADHCTRYRYRYSECSRCADACPHAAITLADDGAAVDGRHCQNCALCVSACHSGAWSSDRFKPIALLREAIRLPRWTLACAPSGETADAIVPCLGAVDAVLLAYLAKRGIPVTLRGSWHCADCAHGKTGAAQLALNLEGLEILHQGAGEKEATPEARAWTPAELAPAPTTAAGSATRRGDSAVGQEFAAGRRQLFRRFFGRGVDEIAAAAQPVEAPAIPEQAIRAGPYFLTEQRELLQIVCQHPEGRPFPVRVHESLPLMQLTLYAGCTVCEACFRVCPTGALRIEENPDAWALHFRADNCVACAACLEVCQPRVLDAEADFDARAEQPPRVLLAKNKQRCQRCDRHFVSSAPEETCPVCRDDEDAFGAIFG